jgi:hypothetical protein
VWPARSASSSIGIIVVASASDAEKIAARLKTGADFEALAREVSIDPTAHDGGHLQVEPKYLLAPLQNALAEIEPGAISAIIRIPEGFAILTRFKETTPRLLPGPPPNVKLTLAVSGYTEFYQVLHNRIPKDPVAARAWAIDLKGVCAAREQAPQDAMAALRDQLKAPEKMEPFRLAYTHYTLGELSSVTGDFETSINGRYRLGNTNDEGWYRGQCRFSKLAPAWGEFYEVEGDPLMDKAPDDWVQLSAPRKDRPDRFDYWRSW